MALFGEQAVARALTDSFSATQPDSFTVLYLRAKIASSDGAKLSLPHRQGVVAIDRRAKGRMMETIENGSADGGSQPKAGCKPRKSLLRRPLVWIGTAVVLAAGAAVTVGALAQPMGMGHGGAGMVMMAMHEGGGGPMGGMWMGRGIDRMLDGVNADDAQRTQIKQIVAAAQTDLKAQRDAGRGLRDRAMTAFTQPTVDAREVEAVRQLMLTQHDATSKRMSAALLDISRVLRPEQRVQLAQRLKQRGDAMRRRSDARQRPGAPTT